MLNLSREVAVPRSPAARIVSDIYDVRHAQDREIARLGAEGPTLDQQRQIAEEAARHRELFADLEMTVPEPGPSDRPLDFTVALLQRLQPFSHDWRNTDLARLARTGGASALTGLDHAIVADAQRVASDRTVGSFRRPGALREIRRGKITDFFGSPSAWMRAFQPPIVTQVEGFRR